jgi:hypothetical protein
VQYVDGEQEWLALRNERVIWRLPPKEDSSSDDDGSSGDDEMLLHDSDGEAGLGSLRRRRKRRVSSASYVCAEVVCSFLLHVCLLMFGGLYEL